MKKKLLTLIGFALTSGIVSAQCESPTGIELDEITATTIEIDWDAGAGSWQYDFGPEGFDAGTEDPTVTDVFPTTGEIADLTPNTTYDFYVRAICGEGDTSDWVGPFTYATPCLAVSSAGFCEGFEPDSETESCWTILDVNDDGDEWNTNYTSNPHTGSHSAVLYTDYNGGDNDDWLISPLLDLEANRFLHFWYRVQSSGEPNDFEVLLSTTGNSPEDFTETLLALDSYSNTTYEDFTIDLSAYEGEVYIAFHVPADGLDGWRLYFDDICIINCPTPTGVELDVLTTTSMKIDWDAGAGSWQYDFGPSGFEAGTEDPTVTDVFPTTGDITDLTPNTSYDFYLRSICGEGDTSLWIGPFTYMTPCEIISSDDFCEGFEPDSETESCWTILNVNGDGDAWNTNYTSNPHTGEESAILYTDYNYGDNDDWLISPHIDLEAGKYLNYWYRVQSDGEPNDFEVLLSTTGNNPEDFTETLVALTSYDNEEYMDALIDLSAYEGEVYIAFHVPADGLDGWRLYFDDICITNCPPLEDLVLDGTTSTTADISWTAGGDETEWVVDFGEPGFEPGGDDVTSVTESNATLEDLMPNTTYEVYVRTICFGGDSTQWIGPLEFHTQCEVISPALFCEGFEDDSETEACWDVLDMNDDGDSWDVDYGYNAHTGSQSATLYTDYNAGDNDDWLISPHVTMSGNEALKFWYRVQSDGEPNDFEVLLSTTGKNPEDFTTTLMELASYDNETYEETSIDLSDYTGDIYIAFHVPADGLDGWRLYFDDICFVVCEPEDGVDGSTDVCIADETIDLNSVITAGEDFGYWEYASEPELVDGVEFNYTELDPGTYTVNYIVEAGCRIDTTFATINVFNAPRPGNAGSVSVCKNQPFDLLAGLEGTVDLGGSWLDNDGEELSDSYVSGIASEGTYTYTYVASNGVCPDETTDITVVVSDCDYLSVDEFDLTNVSIYPNPTTGLLTINTAANTIYNYEIVDVSGRVISTENNVTGSTQIDLSEQESGVYMIRVFNESTEQRLKVILK